MKLIIVTDILSKLLILFLIKPNIGDIKINITTASSKEYVLVNYTGYDNKLITDREVQLFNITKDNLNRGFRIELGKAPDNFFLKDPTAYGDLYQKYNWSEVQRHMVIKQATVLDVIHEQVVVKTVEVFNNDTDKIKLKKSMNEDVELTIFSFWSKDGFPTDDISYDVCIDLTIKKPSKWDEYCFKNKWRNSTFESIKDTLGVDIRKGWVDVEPGQTIVSKLIANKTIIFVEFQYSAILIGRVIADYERLYGKYHFYAPSVSDIMRAGSIPNEIITTERIEIRGYTDPKLVMYDKDTGEEIKMYRRIKLVGSKKRRTLVYLDD
ncbi:uncharacterized protein LOC106130390 [Amyelois transitella]|uniref:uncharacterized protein LOC106130390 n=1 Tax=Amyelois transitella TaxID=680683 RepID=UPI00067AE964|nr:uncharacterized protein LOC106130390 [Amyelois transitella]